MRARLTVFAAVFVFLAAAGQGFSAAPCETYAQTDCSMFVQNAEDYANQAVQETDKNRTYTLYISAATEYDKAGTCLSCKNLSSSASYSSALSNYLKAVPFLTTGGDYKLRGETYEKAGGVSAALKNVTGAAYYYDLAEAECLKAETPDQAWLSALRAKREALLSQPPPEPEAQPGFDFSILLIPAAAFIIIAAVFVFFAYKGRGASFLPRLSPKRLGREQREERREERPSLPVREERQTRTPPALPESRLEREEAEAAKQKMRDKIRSRYGL